MKKTIKTFLAIVLCLGMITLTGKDAVNTFATDAGDVSDAQNNVDESKKKLEEVKNELASIKNEISDTQSKIKELDAMASNLTNELVAANAKVDAKQAEIDAKQAEINDKNQQIADSEAELSAAQEKEKEQYDAMKLRIQYMYECGEDNFLDMIFSSEDMSELLGRTEYISQITSYDRQQLQKIVDTKTTINTLLATLDSDKAILVTQRTELEAQQSELLSLQANVEAQQSYVNEVISAKNSALSGLENDQAATQEQVKLAEQEVADQIAIYNQIKAQWQAQQAAGVTDKDTQKTLEAIGLAGGFTWPLPGYNTITSRWGNRLHPILGYYTLHDGMDISGWNVYGKPIIAAYSGTVTMAQYYGGYGNCVQINHGAGVTTLYAHMSNFNVAAGQTVKAGDVIGYVGSTGNSTGAHLHFSIYINGTSVNPENYIVIPK